MSSPRQLPARLPARHGQPPRRAPCVRDEEEEEKPKVSPLLTEDEMERYSRQLLLPEWTELAQVALRDASVLVVGAGALGSPVALYLAGAGVGRLGLVDSDIVEISNLHRQPLHFTPDIGAAKVESAASKLRFLNPEVLVEPYQVRLEDDNALGLVEGQDLVVDCSDSFETRYAVNPACCARGQPGRGRRAGLERHGHGHPPALQGVLSLRVPGRRRSTRRRAPRRDRRPGGGRDRRAEGARGAEVPHRLPAAADQRLPQRGPGDPRRAARHHAAPRSIARTAADVRRLALGLVAAVSLAWCAPAHAYRLGGARWPTHTISYYDGGPNHAAVRVAVHAWNTSGAHVRFVPTSRARAHVRIVALKPSGCAGVEGVATLGYSPRGDLVQLRACPDQDADAVVAAHELGHVLGLNHETKRCATMNPVVGQKCAPPPNVSTLCRVLQADDVQGAVRRYGGHARKITAPQNCPIFSEPQAPTTFTVTGGAPPSTQLSGTLTVAGVRKLDAVPGWPTPNLYVTIYRYAGTCPAGAPQGDPVAEQPRRRPGPFSSRSTRGPR